MRVVEINHSVLFVHGVQEFIRIQKTFFVLVPKHKQGMCPELVQTFKSVLPR